MYNGIVCPMRIQPDPFGAIELLEKEKATTQRIKKPTPGRKRAKRTYEANLQPRKTVYLFNLKYEYVREFESMKKTAKFIDSYSTTISKRCKRETPFEVKGYYVSLKRNPSWEAK